MPSTPLLLQNGDSLLITSGEGLRELWGVTQRVRNGYLLRKHGNGESDVWSNDRIADAHIERRLIHYPFDESGLSKALSEVVAKAWEYWPRAARRVAERRQKYAQHVDAIRTEHVRFIEACEAASIFVFEENAQAWREEDLAETVEKSATTNQRRRNRTLDYDGNLPSVEVRAQARPSASSVRAWYQNWKKHGEDVRVLLPLHHLKGNRTPRAPQYVSEQPDAYSLMDVAIQRYYLAMPRRSKKAAYSKYVELCHRESIKPFSCKTLRLRIRDKHTDREEYERRYGRRAAYLKFKVFERTELPKQPLEEVEIDHCLIDLFVVEPITRKVIGRPWLTAIIDRCTRMILGVHLSFEPPSYASLQRALAHAFWPKNLSGIPDLEDDWPCHGIPWWVICDNGKEFRSASLRASEALMHFDVVNLPVKKPWLKGSVERLFRTIGVQVFSTLEGTTLSRTPDFYEPMGRARHTLDEVKAMLIKWIVNDYHRARHGTLGCSPIAKWRQLTELYPVRPVPDFTHIVRLTGEVVAHPISNIGVNHKGLLYSDPAILEKLRARRGGLAKDWLIRIDPYDVGEAWILDDAEGEWFVLPCTNQAISRKVSRFQHKVHGTVARQLVPPGQPVTEDHLLEAKRLCEEALADAFSSASKTAITVKAARYATSGETFTPLGLDTGVAAPEPEAPTSPCLGVPAPPPIAAPRLVDLSAEVAALTASWLADRT
jgi:putative transposase